LGVLESQHETLEQVCQRIFESLRTGGVLHVFGSGHSNVFAQEMFHRAGGLVPVNAWLEEHLMPHAGPKQVGPLERLSGLAPIMMKKYEPQRGEVLIICSNSGINASSVELAECAKSQGLFVVAVTSLTHSKGVPSRSGGKKLFEVSDAVLDTGTPLGDACVSLPDLDVKVGPLSGAVTLVVAELITVGVAECFTRAGEVPPVYQSANTPGGDERNKKMEAKYAPRIRCLR
jgi:uncharacterized phosphosugar-binding protein